MGTPQLRNEIKNFIKEADERFLKMVYAMAVAYSNKEIVAYGTDGTPLTKEAYKKRLNEAEFDIKEGRVLSSEKLKKQIKNWRKGLK